ncbi:sorting nexin-8-like isoform X2 [Cloeon dipterum]|uniref:sorting nexin-8-like isoform X2 n=1 Tax=Cloeon dipterum TaxID=197152 RepID=UPI0032201C05
MAAALAPESGDVQEAEGNKENGIAADYMIGLTYNKLFEHDVIDMDLAPEKWGVLTSHQEYFVKSKRFNSCVERRYTDFVSFHELLIATYPYRLVPRLPPKKLIGADTVFIEERRKALKRWLTIVAQHPILSADATTRFFLTFEGPKVHAKIQEIFRRMPDEFTTSCIASKSKELVKSVSPTLIANSRNQIQVILAGISQLKRISERMVARSQEYASDLSDIGIVMLEMSNDNQDSSEWAAKGNKIWEETKMGFKLVANEFNDLYAQASDQATVQKDEVLEKLNLLFDVLTAHQLLCERHEKGVAQDHQRALAKMLAFKKVKIQKSISGTDTETLERLEKRMMEQESIIADVEVRSAFSLHCMTQETQLVHTYLGIVTEIFNSLISVQLIGHSEMSKVWKGMQEKIFQCLPSNSETAD